VSHLSDFVCPEFTRAPTVQCLAWSLLVVPAAPHTQRALRVIEADEAVLAQLRSFHLADAAEEQDPTCRPVLGYGRSLLYLVSESFEGEIHTPILGMEKYFQAATDGLPQVKRASSTGSRRGRLEDMDERGWLIQTEYPARNLNQH
jgi:hypothetical protein